MGMKERKRMDMRMSEQICGNEKTWSERRKPEVTSCRASCSNGSMMVECEDILECRSL